MLFLTDANVFIPMIQMLRQSGHDILDLKEEGLEKLSDEEVFRLAQEQHQIM